MAILVAQPPLVQANSMAIPLLILALPARPLVPNVMVLFTPSVVLALQATILSVI